MLRLVAKTVTVTVLALGCFLVPMARAQGHPSYEASIPFAFYIGDALLPAGTYHITQPAQNLLFFRNERAVATGYQLVFATRQSGRAPTGQLTFTRYGNSHFLQKFSAPDESSGPHMASICVRGSVESRTAKKFADANSRAVAVNSLPGR